MVGWAGVNELSFTVAGCVLVTLEEKKIYHQIHPLQLSVDILTGFGAVYLLWQRSLLLGVCCAFIPSTVVSLYIIAKMDLEKYKNSRFGVYVRKHMASKSADWLRFGGFAVMLMGGWLMTLWVVALGFLIVLLIWTKGILANYPAPKNPSA